MRERLSRLGGPAGVRVVWGVHREREHVVKKLLFVVGAAVVGSLVKKKIDAGHAEQALWQEATDPVQRS
ncbi:hypothetical protein GCM10027425_24730 [Alteromonas gracilis]